jgi:hypothetical protein
MDEPLRPDRCGIVFELFTPEKFVVAMVDQHRRDAWKSGRAALLIQQMLRDGFFVWIMVGKDRTLLLPTGCTEREAHARSAEAYKRKVGAGNDSAQLH